VLSLNAEVNPYYGDGTFVDFLSVHRTGVAGLGRRTNQRISRMPLLELVVRRLFKLTVATDRRFLIPHSKVNEFSGDSNFTRRLVKPLQHVLDVFPPILGPTYSDGVEGVPVRIIACEVLRQHRPSCHVVLGRRIKMLNADTHVGGVVLPELVKRRLHLCDTPAGGNRSAAISCSVTEHSIETLSLLRDMLDEGLGSYT
jgi:hypothetical protein